MDKSKIKPVVNVRARTEEVARKHGAAIDEEIDKFIANKYKSTFKPQSFMKGFEVSGVVAKRLLEFYTPLANELSLVVGGDPEVCEAYHIGIREAQRYFDFVNNIVTACNVVVDRAKATRKPRAKKAQAPAKVVATLKLLLEFETLGLKSLSPESILGSSEIWFYDTEKRKLVIYRAADTDGLGVKGTTILNYNEKTSGMRPVRKPEHFFGHLNLGVRGLLRAWNDIRGKVTPVKGRTNDNMILLAIG